MKSQFQFDEEVLYMNKSISRIIGVIMLIVASPYYDSRRRTMRKTQV